MAGNGQCELAEVITGLRAAPAGSGERRDIANASARHAISQGVAHVPEDRTGVGSAPNLSIIDNLIMKPLPAPPIGAAG